MCQLLISSALFVYIFTDLAFTRMMPPSQLLKLLVPDNTIDYKMSGYWAPGVIFRCFHTELGS